MHIAFLTPTLELAGGTIVLRHYVDALLKQGHLVTVISPARGEWEMAHENLRLITYPAVKVRYSDTLTFQLPYWRTIIKAIPDSVDWLIPIYTPLLVPAAQYRKRHPGTGILLIAQESMEVPVVGPYNRWLLSRQSMQRALTGIVAVSDPLAAQVRAIVDTALPVSTIVNGIEHSIFKPSSKPRRNELLFVGRPDVTKGYPTFVAVLEMLHKEFPELRGRVAAPQRYTINHPLITHSPSTQRELADHYAQAKVYVNVSIAESFGFPPLEAMACATPVVLTPTTGVQQYAVDHENCLVVPFKNVDATAAAIRTLISNPSLAKKLTDAGKITASRFDWSVSRDLFLQVLADLEQNR